jgi:hypothetical protein
MANAIMGSACPLLLGGDGAALGAMVQKDC